MEWEKNICKWGNRQRINFQNTQITHAAQYKKKTTQSKNGQVLVTQSCPALCDLMDCHPPDSSGHGILQARILEWVAIPFSKKWMKDLNRHFFKEDLQMAKKHLKRCSTSLIIREMQIKTTKRYCRTLVRIVIIKNSTNNKCLRGCGEKGTFLCCWQECKFWYTHCGKQ